MRNTNKWKSGVTILNVNFWPDMYGSFIRTNTGIFVIFIFLSIRCSTDDGRINRYLLGVHTNQLKSKFFSHPCYSWKLSKREHGGGLPTYESMHFRSNIQINYILWMWMIVRTYFWNNLMQLHFNFIADDDYFCTMVVTPN